MTALLELTVYFTVWTLMTVVVGGAIRNQEWTKEGRQIGLGNRDNLKEATPMGGRAERAAKNSIEAAVFFVPLGLMLMRQDWMPRCYSARKSPFGHGLPTYRFTSQALSICAASCGSLGWSVTG